MFKIVETSVHVVSGCHIFLGLLSVIVGVISSIKADVWLAHRVSPIWSGGFFLVAGILGIWCARRKSSYVIMCFTAFSVVSMVVAVVSIQLLRVGLVNYTTDGHTFQKEKQDVLIYLSLAAAGTEILVCMAAIILSCRIARVAKEELSKQRDGMFYVKVLGQKDIVVVTKPVDDNDELTAV
ncbi:transmembrane protein 196-like [Biomphalaria glabrata]|uniref:Transmembrane protein 196 n=3 Tax=Biomphalaria TaxID=6525 RepID=A0A2C9LR20_BIOGL|nr:transmembrane protein 196-like [Biomphalaria glabrata]